MCIRKSKLKMNVIIKCFILACILFVVFGRISIIYAESGYDYDTNAPTTGHFTMPHFTGVRYDRSSSGTVDYTVTASLSGTTGTGRDMYWEGYTRLWLENPKGGGEICIGQDDGYSLSFSGQHSDSDSWGGSISYSNLDQMIDMFGSGSPSIGYSGFNSSTKTCYASAYGASKSGTAELELCVYVTYWNGPPDDQVKMNLASTDRVPESDRFFNINFSSTDPIECYYYTYDYDSYSYTVSSWEADGYGYGSYFSNSPGINNAGKYCHVTFYTESGKSCSTVIKVPDAVNLTYNLNGGPGYTPSTQTVWRGETVTLANKPTNRQNCEFLGWSTTKYDVLEYGKTVSNLLSPGTAYTLNSNTTLYAVWRTIKVPYTINFTLNGNKPAKNDFAYITGYVNGGTRVTQSREFSVLEIPGYTVSAKIKSSVDFA